MRYRKFPKVPGLRISTLGLGMMRLPTLGGDSARIDAAAAEKIFLMAMEQGVNYIDTAYPYHGGTSEAFTGGVIEKHRLRDSLYLATKCPVWQVKTRDDWEGLLNEQLRRLRTDRIDFYLLHALNAERWDTILRLGGLEAMERALADGRIAHLGFSFHDSPTCFKTIVDGYDKWEFCQIQYNYLDRDYQAGITGIRYAAGRGIGSIIMEPLRGGALAKIPEEVRAIFDNAGLTDCAAATALRYVLDREEVVTVLSGMGTTEQVRENAGVVDTITAGALTEVERKAFRDAADWYHARMPVPCTTCAYCMPCPSGVAIPEVFSLYNGAVAFNERQSQGSWYKKAYVGEGKGGGDCVSCGACLSKCPQAIPIIEKLAEAHRYLA